MGSVRVEVQVTVTPGGFAAATAPSAIDGPLGSSPVSLSGGVTVWVDPLHPERFFRIEAFALEEAQGGILDALVGATAATVIAEAADCAVWERSFAPTTTVLEFDGDRWAAIGRLGFLLWLEDYAVLPLDQSDLDIEVGVVAHNLASLGTDRLAGERFGRAYPRLLARAREFAADDSVDWTSDDDIVARALDLAESFYLPDISEAESAELHSLGSELAARLTAAGEADSADFDAALVMLAGTERRQATIAGTGEGGPHSSLNDTVDWNLVVRNALSTEEDTVHWRWTDSPTRRIEVRVDAMPRGLPGRAISRSLMFGVTRPSGGEYVAAGSLEYSADENEYVGYCHLDEAPTSGQYVQVYAVNTVRAPAGRVERLRLLGMREATRGFLDERLPNSRGQFETTPLPIVRERWIRAARAFQLASQQSEGQLAERDGRRQTVCVERVAAIGNTGSPAMIVAELPALSLAEKMFFRALRSA